MVFFSFPENEELLLRFLSNKLCKLCETSFAPLHFAPFFSCFSVYYDIPPLLPLSVSHAPPHFSVLVVSLCLWWQSTVTPKLDEERLIGALRIERKIRMPTAKGCKSRGTYIGMHYAVCIPSHSMNRYLCVWRLTSGTKTNRDSPPNLTFEPNFWRKQSVGYFDLLLYCQRESTGDRMRRWHRLCLQHRPWQVRT